MRLESLQIGSDDPARAAADYEGLLGIDPTDGPYGPRFRLTTGAVDIVRGEPGVASIGFLADVGDQMDAVDFHGLHVLAVPSDAGVAPAARLTAPDCPSAIDHIVVNTPDIERAIALWRDRCGLRLALDREFPNRGLRLVFFRSGGITLEIAGVLGAAADSSAPDRYWGVAYRVENLTVCRERLLSAGVSVSEIRPGQKRGTIVATVKSHTAGVPTLLIQTER